MPEQVPTKAQDEEVSCETGTKTQTQQQEIEEETQDSPTEKSNVGRNNFAPDHLPEFHVDDEVSAKSYSGGVTRKVVARIVKRQTNPRRYYEYRLSLPADTSKWYRESELDWA